MFRANSERKNNIFRLVYFGQLAFLKVLIVLFKYYLVDIYTPVVQKTFVKSDTREQLFQTFGFVFVSTDIFSHRHSRYLNSQPVPINENKRKL